MNKSQQLTSIAIESHSYADREEELEGIVSYGIILGKKDLDCRLRYSILSIPYIVKNSVQGVTAEF